MVVEYVCQRIKRCYCFEGGPMTTRHYDCLTSGPIDEIDAAIWSGDVFHNRSNIAEFRAMMARWERGLKEAEQILEEQEKDNA